MTLSATITHGNREFTADVDDTGRVSIDIDGVWAGKGRWTGTRIADCPAVLDADPDTSEEIYDALDAALTEAAAVTPETRCAYCHADVPDTHQVPPAHDDDAWVDEAERHAEDCEWVATRAHRRDLSTAAALLGRKGGTAGTEAQAQARRANGRKGGRPSVYTYRVTDGTKREPKGHIGYADSRRDALALKAAKCRMGGYITRERR